MLRCSKRIWKQTAGYGAIADAFRRKYLKMLENFVVVNGAPCTANGRNLLNKSTQQGKRAAADQAGPGRVLGGASGARAYLPRLMTGLDSLSEVITMSRLLMSSAFLSSEIFLVAKFDS